MVTAKPQLSIAGLKTQSEADAEEADKAARREQRAILRARLMAAIRSFARERTIATCADELDQDDRVFGGGKGVSSSTLRSCLEGVERNYFRADWLLWFAEESDEVAEVLLEIAGHGLPTKDPKEELRDLQELVRAEIPRQAEKIIKKAKAPR